MAITEGGWGLWSPAGADPARSGRAADGPPARRPLVAEIQAEGVGEEKAEHGVVAKAGHQHLAAPLLLQVLRRADGKGVAGADQGAGSRGEQLPASR